MKTITDSQRLISATRHNSPVPVYDDGFGALYIHLNSLGISGIVRAKTWEDAYSICEDEFFPEATETIEELRAEYNFRREHKKVIRVDGVERFAEASDYPLSESQFVRWETIITPCEDENGWTENELFQEAFGYRPNGPSSTDVLAHGLYAKDLNGDRLDLLTPALIAELGITLTIENES